MEAMHWVLVWFSFRYEDGREIPAARRPLEKWVPSLVLDDVKNSFLHTIEGHPTPPFSGLDESWIIPLSRLFSQGHGELTSYTRLVDLGKSPVFPPDAPFFHDTSMWTAFWKVLNPNEHVDFDDVCNSARLGFLPCQGHSSL